MTTYDAIILDTLDFPEIISSKKIVPFYNYYSCKSSKIAPEGLEVIYLEELVFSGIAQYNCFAGKEIFREVAFLTNVELFTIAPYFHFGELLLACKDFLVLETPEFYIEHLIETAGVTFSVVCPNLKFGYNTLLSDGILTTEGLSLTGKLIYLTDGQFVSFGVPDTGKDILISTAAVAVTGFIIKSIFVYNGNSAVTNTIPSFEVITLAVAGNTNVQLKIMTISAYGGATGAITFPFLDCSSTGLLGISGNYNDFLPLIACNSSGTVSLTGTTQEILPLFNCNATAFLGPLGNVAIFLELIELESTGQVAIVANGNIIFPVIICYGRGRVVGRFTDEILRHSRY